MKTFLRMASIDVKEGIEIGGGESDLILPGDLVVENKVAGETDNPTELLPNSDWQARRYSIAVNQRVTFVAIAYKPASDKALLPLPQRVSVVRMEGAPEHRAVVRILIPYGQAVPSKAKA